MKLSLHVLFGTFLALSFPLLAEQPAAAAPAAAAPAVDAPAAEAPAAPVDPLALTTDKQRGSYAFGMNVGRNLGPIAKQLDLDVFIRALRDSVSGGKLAMDDVEGREAFMAFQSGAMNAAQAANLEDGKAYLKKNLADKDVVQLASGLQYKIVKAGEGAPPKSSDVVKVHYTGTTIDGTKFDSSRDRGEPAEFPVNGVIPGWTEALQLMSPGARYLLTIPSDLAYGERGNQRIAPNSVLLFDVELLDVKAPKPSPNPFK